MCLRMMLSAVKDKRGTIWAFILKNAYRPRILFLPQAGAPLDSNIVERGPAPEESHFVSEELNVL